MANSSVATTARERRAADRRNEILASARQAFSAKGFENTSMAEIASAVGIVEGALYKHFDSKRDLLFEAIRQFYAPHIEETREQLAAVKGTRNRLHFVIWRQLRTYQVEPGMCRLVIEEIRPRSDYHQSIVADLNRELTSVVLSIVQEGIDRGELRGDLSPATVRDVIYGGSEHLAWKALAGHAPLDVDRIADELTDLVWRGAEKRATRTDEERDETAGLAAQVNRLEAAVETLITRQNTNERGTDN